MKGTHLFLKFRNVPVCPTMRVQFYIFVHVLVDVYVSGVSGQLTTDMFH